MAAYVHVTGNIGKSPELRNSRNQYPYVTFGVAHNYKKPDAASGEEVAFVDWYNCRLSGPRANIIAEHFGAGTPIQVHGRLTHRHYVKRNGESGCALELQVTDFDFVPTQRSRDAETPSRSSTPEAMPASPEEPKAPTVEELRLEDHPDVLIGGFPG